MVETWSEAERKRFLTRKRQPSTVVDNEEEKVRDIFWLTTLTKKVREKFSALAGRPLKGVRLKVGYKRPPTLRSLIFKPRSLENVVKRGSSQSRGHCQLCGNFRAKYWSNMVPDVKVLAINNNTLGERSWNLSTSLNCKSNEIYIAISTVPSCGETYRGVRINLTPL